MAQVRPLRLKSEVFKKVESQRAQDLPIAQVLVDSGIYHLDSAFDYSIPLSISDDIQIGIRVIVPFNGREVEGLVIGRSEDVGARVKSISKVISTIPVATPSLIELIQSVATRWAAHPYDLLRSAIPARVAKVESGFSAAEISKPIQRTVHRKYIQLPPYISATESLRKYIEERVQSGPILVIVPDFRIAEKLKQLLPTAILLDSILDRSLRYKNFLEILGGKSNLVIGTRSAIFAPLVNISEIVVFNEGSEHLYEIRSPGWNVRDVAILRSQIENLSLTFLGYCPSSEVARLIESRWLSFESIKMALSVSSYSQTHSELLPGRIFTDIRIALKSGSVLFIAPRKGYSQAISCAKCRNIALCGCGGKLFKSSMKSLPECTLCGKRFPDWRCHWCQAITPFLIGRGSARILHEIGAAFPGVAIVTSEGERIIDHLTDFRGIVIATPGSIPDLEGGYSALLILEGDTYFSYSDTRAHERARELFFSSASYLSEGGKIVLVISDNNPIIASLASWKPSLSAQRDLRERQEVGLPPYSRGVTLDAERGEIHSILRGLESAKEDGRLPSSIKILGPSTLPAGKSRLLILAPLKDGSALVALIHEFQRKRSASGKTLVRVRIDPYSLSR